MGKDKPGQLRSSPASFRAQKGNVLATQRQAVASARPLLVPDLSEAQASICGAIHSLTYAVAL